MEIVKHDSYIELRADENMYLTQVKDGNAKIFTDSVCLGKEDSISNWREVDKAEKEEWEASSEQRMIEAAQKYAEEQKNN